MLLLTYKVQKVVSEFMNNIVLFKHLMMHIPFQISYQKLHFLYLGFRRTHNCQCKASFFLQLTRKCITSFLI